MKKGNRVQIKRKNLNYPGALGTIVRSFKSRWLVRLDSGIYISVDEALLEVL